VLESELEDLAVEPIDSLEVAIAHIAKARRLPQC